MAAATQELIRIAEETIGAIVARMPLIDATTHALNGMEEHPIFNAGYGSVIQGDGEARLTAALMNGELQSFSGVIGATNMRFPSLIAKDLQHARSRVMTMPGIELLATRLGIKRESPISDERRKQYEERLKTRKQDGADMGFDTVGCVVRDKEGLMAAGTSTGGRGFEMPGRVSDAATVAGTYASRFAAISATGVGEQIVDDALAARLETRVRDGLTLAQASARALQEGNSAVGGIRQYGWIALDAKGGWATAHLTPTMSYVVMSASGLIASSMPK